MTFLPLCFQIPIVKLLEIGRVRFSNNKTFAVVDTIMCFTARATPPPPKARNFTVIGKCHDEYCMQIDPRQFILDRLLAQFYPKKIRNLLRSLLSIFDSK